MGSLLDQFGTPYPKAALLADSLTNIQTGMGLPGNDPTLALQYVSTHFLTQFEAENAFLNSFIIGRFIELPAMHMTREWREVHIEGDDKGDKAELISEAEDALNVKAVFTEAQMWGDLYGGALIVMGLDGEALEDPLDVKGVRRGQLTSLTVVDRWQVTPSAEFILDPLDPNFRYPEYYNIGGPSSQYRIHASRCLRFDGSRLPRLAWLRNNRWHGSTVQRVLDAIKGFEASVKASSKAMQEGSVDIYAIEGLYERLTEVDGQTIVRNRVKLAQDLKSIYRAVLIDSKDELRRQGISVEGYDKLLGKHQDIVCGATEMPATLLFGRPPEGMNATGDADFRNWYDTLSLKQEFKLRPILNQFDQVLWRSALGEYPVNSSFDFRPLWQVSDGEAAGIALQQAQARNIYLTAGAYKPETCAADLLAEGFSVSMTQEDVDDIEEYNEPIEPVDAAGQPLDPAAVIAGGSPPSPPSPGGALNA